MSFKFKGGRDYIHGTDLYDAMIAQARKDGFDSDGKIQFSIHKMLRYQSRLCGGPDPQASAQKEAPAKMKIVSSLGKEWSYWIEEGSEKIEERYPFNEDEIVAAGRLEENSISLKASTGFRPIEECVALTKGLHNKIFSEARGKWVFTRLDLDRDFESETIYPLKIENRVFRGKLTRSLISFNNRNSGSIYFSLM